MRLTGFVSSRIFTLLVLLAGVVPLSAQTIAHTADGEAYVIHPDGRWQKIAKDSALQHVALHIYAQPGATACTRIAHQYYCLGYDASARQPAWAYYHLTRTRVDSAVLERKGSFVADPKTTDKQGNDNDYAGSGYDKGHMVPCEDMSFGAEAMKETFYYSNCVPQTTKLNRGQWKNLEQLVRNWTIDNGAIDIIAGPVIEKGLKTLGESRIVVPERCYKIVLDYQSVPPKAIAFVMPNQSQALNNVQTYACSVDEVEALTGIDFFPELPDALEAKLEAHCDTTLWNWKVKRGPESFPPQAPVSKDLPDSEKQTPVQCSATTQKGERCKRHTSSPNGKCSQHGGN